MDLNTPPPGETKVVLEEEQLALLGKMLLKCLDVLTGREREVYDLLVEELSQKAFRLHRLESKLHPPRRRPIAPLSMTPLSSSSRPLKASPMLHKTPEEVVRIFINCWNEQDFATEYHCLSDTFSKGGRSGHTLEEYVKQRNRKHHERGLSAPREKSVENISSAAKRGKVATLDCVEIHLGQDEDLSLTREYILGLEGNCWKIKDFTTKKRHVNVHARV